MNIKDRDPPHRGTLSKSHSEVLAVEVFFPSGFSRIFYIELLSKFLKGIGEINRMEEKKKKKLVTAEDLEKSSALQRF